MAQRNIDFGTFPDDPSADAIRTAFEKVQQNFTELYSTVDAQAVLSINRTPGAGITASSPTGNVVVSANLANVTLRSNTLSINGDRSNSSGTQTISSSVQELGVDLPRDVSDVDNLTLDETLTANIVNANVINSSLTLNGNVANFSGSLSSNTLNVSGNATFGNIGGNGTSLTSLNASNLTTGIVPSDRLSGSYSISVDNAANANFANTVGTVTSNAQPNITSVGTLTNLDVANDITAVNITANTGVFTGNGFGLTNLAGGNVTGTVANATFADVAGNADVANTATVAETVTTNAQPNITSVGSLTDLTVLGNIISNTVDANTITVETANTSLNINDSESNLIIDENTFESARSFITGNSINYAVSNVDNGSSSNVEITSSAINMQTTGNALVTATENFLVTSNNITVSETNVDAPALTIDSANANITLNNDGLSVTRDSTLFSVSETAITSSTLGDISQIAQGNMIQTAGQDYALNAGGTLGISSAGDMVINSGSNLEIVGQNFTVSSGGNIFSNGSFSANDLSGDGSGLSNLTGANVTGTVANATNATTSETVTSNAQPNIESVGTLVSLDVQGNITSGNIDAGDLLTANLLEGTLTTANQPNITEIGTLNQLDVSGNLSAGNIDGGNLVSANFIQGDGSLLTNISVSAGSVIENGNSEVRVDANSNVRVSVDGVSNVAVFTENGLGLGGFVSASNVIATNDVSANTLTGELTTSSQPNLTSLGNLTSLTVDGVSNLGPVGNVTITGGVANAFLLTDGSGNLSWNTATLVPAQGNDTEVIFNDGGNTYAGDSGLTYNKTTDTLTVSNNVVSGNVYANSGTVGANLLAGTLTTASQPNITSIGTLNSLIVSGNINASNLSVVNDVNASRLGGELTTSAQPNITTVGTLTSLDVSGDVTAANVTANTGVFTGNGSGLTDLVGANITGEVANASFATNADSATTAETVTTNAQPNITSVGTLSSLIVNGNINAGNISITGKVSAADLEGDGSNITNISGDEVVGTVANANAANFANVAFNVDGANVSGEVANANFATNAENANIANVSDTSNSVAGANVSGAVSFASTANAVAGANVSGAVSFASTANAVAGANVSGEVSFANTANSVAGANVSGEVANATFATSSDSANIADTANSVAGANVSGTVANASFATTSGTASTVTTNAQPNITSVGTLTSLSVSGNVSAENLTANSFHIRSVDTGIIASGSTQGDATGLTKEINVVSTVSGTSGVRLPATVAGMIITITNTTANSLRVYPASGGTINTLATDQAFVQGPGATLQFIAPTTTQWYTTGATYA